MIALLVALSCQDDAMLDALAPPDVAVELAVESKKIGGSEELVLELRLTAMDEWEAEPFELEFEDLEVEELSAEILELPGGEQTVYRYGVNGKAGSHVLVPQTFSFRSSDGKILERESSKIFVDIGVDGPTAEVLGLAALPAEIPSPWPRRIKWALLVSFIGLVCAWGVFKRLKKPVPPPPAVPADQEALAAWAAVLAEATLDDHERALALSQIFRRYLERVFSLPASAFTSAEVLALLQGELSDIHLGKSKRLLSATDRIKYARRGGGSALFRSLDEDFREIVEETKPTLLIDEDAKHA